ncbi:MAG: hypothetical protein Q8P89_00280 [bacterium]|nr:hypothetical protein [bacterium]
MEVKITIESQRDARIIAKIAFEKRIPVFTNFEDAIRFLEGTPPLNRWKILSLQGRQLVFAAVLDNQPLESAKEFYLENRYTLCESCAISDRYYYLRHAVGKRILDRKLERAVISDAEGETKVKAEALRRFDLDLEVAKYFSQLGILQELKALEAEEITQIKRGEDVPAINPRFTELIRQAKLSSNP